MKYNVVISEAFRKKDFTKRQSMGGSLKKSWASTSFLVALIESSWVFTIQPQGTNTLPEIKTVRTWKCRNPKGKDVLTSILQ